MGKFFLSLKVGKMTEYLLGAIDATRGEKNEGIEASEGWWLKNVATYSER